MKKIKVVIVEDDQEIRKLVEEILSYEPDIEFVRSYSNGDNFLKAFNEITCDVVLMDINMPKMNGIEFLKIMRENEKLKNISVFVMTTSNEDSDKINAYSLNVAGYILKPLSFEKFLTSVATLKNFWQLCEM